MKLIIFFESTAEGLPASGRNIKDSLKEYLLAIGSAINIEEINEQYAAALVNMNRSGMAQLSTSVKINGLTYTCRFFIEFKQFKRFILNMEKRFITFYGPEESESFVSSLLNQMREFKIGKFRVTITKRDSEQSQETVTLPSSQFIFELEQKKNGLTATKLQKMNAGFKGRINFEKLRILRFFLEKIREHFPPVTSYEYARKPTNKLHHLLGANVKQEKDGKMQDNYVFRVSAPMQLKPAD
jgi:hypothetical protein